MDRRKPITENDKLAEAKRANKQSSLFLDQELGRWEEGKIDREMLCAGIEAWQASQKEIFRIENAERELKYKKECEQLEREAFNKRILEEMDGKSD